MVKGWTTDLSDFIMAPEDQEKSTATGMQNRSTAHISPSPRNKERHDCYFVLCVQCENGVAKRQAPGKVFATVWERNQEPVDLILG